MIPSAVVVFVYHSVQGLQALLHLLTFSVSHMLFALASESDVA